ncbi:MFS transporter [Anaerobacillus arseniciselenatis]|uniref:MFS transporter n=1 Tax=Anaerobacillus arseniciselenatis TaxID=85682 RepID=A0A1S2LQQ7_9BACI|nr:DHA2 family efflux MFS transporter permease subunit [Anaerobacillus arseniciselenatis]OIJ14530.1 MFS transporter [Anaerobacillus arseniciselenatis]
MNQSFDTNRPPYGIIAVLMIGAFIAFLNNTLLNIALPAIMAEFKVEAATVQWLTTGFMLVSGILVPVSAFLIQKYSVRRLFLVAMGLFTVGTFLAGFAHIFPLLLIGRMTQASGTAILMPLLMNVMLVSFPVEKRGTAMGFFGLIMMGAPAIGPTLSGFLVENYGWRMLFHFVSPVAVGVFFIGFFLLKDKKEHVNLRLDKISLLLSSVGFGGLLYGFSSAGNLGWQSPVVFAPIIIGGLSLVTFIRRQLKQEKPMLNFQIFKYPMYSLSASISMVISMAMFSGMILFPIYVQTLRGISPFDAGLLMMPGAILMAVMSPINGRLFDKFGGRILAITGLTLITVTSYMFSNLTLETSYMTLMLLFSIRMFGMSMVFMPVSTNGLNQLPKRFYPHGTAMNNTMQQVSGAIGTALLITVMSIRTQTHATNLGATTSPGVVTPDPIAAGDQLMMLAMLEGINDAFLVSVYLSAFALVLAMFIKRAKPAEDPIEEVEVNKELNPKLAEN